VPSRLMERLTYANVMATIAFFLALGGGAVATFKVPKNSVGTIQLKNGAVTGAKLHNGAVTGAKVANGSLTGRQINASTLGTVPNASSLGGSPASAYVKAPVGPTQFGVVPAVRVTNSGNEFTSDGVFALVTFDTSQYDNAGMHSTSTNTSRLTAPISGVYDVDAQVVWPGNSNGARELVIMKDGAPFVGRSSITVNSATDVVEQQVSTQVDLRAGDYVELLARQSSGGALSLLSEDNEPIFAMHWLGP
jgi:hypothetical protein